MKTPEEIITEMNWTYDSDPGRFQMWEQLVKPAMLSYRNQTGKLKDKHFQYHTDLTKFVNDNKVKAISITDAGKYSEGYILFYED